MRPESPARTVLDKYLRMAAARYAVAEGRLLPTFCFGQGLSGRDRAAPYALLDDLAPRSTKVTFCSTLPSPLKSPALSNLQASALNWYWAMVPSGFSIVCSTEKDASEPEFQ